MKLIIYNKENSLSTSMRTGERTIGFNRKAGMIYLSRVLAAQIDLKEEDKIILANDEEDKKAWYFSKTTEESGFSLKNNKGGIRLTNKLLASKVLDSVKIDSNATFLVSKEATEVDGLVFYRIITSGPLFALKNKRISSNNKK